MTKLFPKNIYKYIKQNGEVGLCVYVCDTDNSNEIIIGCIEEIDNLNNDFIKMNNGLSKVLYLDRYLTLKLDSIIEPLFLRGASASITSEEFQKLTISIYKLLLLKFDNHVINCANKNYKDDMLKDITLPERLIKLLTWTNKKVDLKFETCVDNLIIMEHCIYFAYLGTNIGSEINKLRPVVVWRKHENKNNIHKDDCYYVFPISSKPARKFYKHNVPLVIENQQDKIMINQGRILSRQRFVKPFIDTNTNQVMKLSKDELNSIKIAIKSYFGV